MRLLTTASRNWEGPWAEDRIAGVLGAFWMLSQALGESFLVLHGDCPTGGDQIVDRWCLRRDILVERYPADWTKYGKQAGPRRNFDMVYNGNPDLCVGFLRGDSPGTTHTLGLARERGIRTWVIAWDPEGKPASAW